MSLASRVTKVQQSLEDTCLRILLSQCRSPESSEKASCVHSPIIKLGISGNLYLCNNLLSFYAKCFGVETARHLFEEMPHRDVVSWTTLVSAYSRNNKAREALEAFSSMVVSGERPNEFTCSTVLQAISDEGELDEGGRIHGYTIKLGFGSNTYLLSSLMDFYAKRGFTVAARKVFGDIKSNGDTVSWTTMISSLVRARKWKPALKHYTEMVSARVPPNELTFLKLLTASRHVDSNHGKLLHAHLIVFGIELSLALKSALVDLYSKFQRMDEAVSVLYCTKEHGVLLWTSIVSGFINSLRVKEAVSALKEMERFGVRPNGLTYSSLLKACSAVPLLELGKQIHSLAIVAGLDDDVFVGNALIGMYMTCTNLVRYAVRAFEEMALPDAISWASLISGLIKHGFVRDCLEWFLRMRYQGVEPNSSILSALLRGCSIIKSRDQTVKLHGLVVKANLESDIFVGNALMDAYAALRMVNDSLRVLTSMKHRDVITYTALATRMNKSGDPETALSVIKRMSEDSVEMDGFSLASFLSSSAAIAATETGKQLHCHAMKSGFLSFASVSNSLIDLYWKCGHAKDGFRAFKEVSEPDKVSWNGLISGLASNGHVSKALSAFDDMRLSGFKPDSVTFSSLLIACSRGGLVEMGIEYFYIMKNTYRITPQLDHYVCLIDLLGRDGQLENAMEEIRSIPFDPDPIIYKTLLSSCRVHKNLLIGEDMFRRGIELDPTDTAFYALLAHLYDDSGRADLASKTRQLMKDKGLRKNIGRSWIELRDKVHFFDAGDRSHPRITEIYNKIDSLATEFKRRELVRKSSESWAYHSEKLAVAFGLLNSPSNAPIHIGKNMQICSECHEFIAMVTQLVNREIIVREGNRIHNFKSGQCSCRGC